MQYKMNTVLVLSVLLSLSFSAPVSEDADAKILSYDNDNNGEGTYEFSFETSNGISRKESGRLVNVGESDEHIEVQGEYSYTDVEGKLVVVRYTADENGYRIMESVPLPSVPKLEQASKRISGAAVASLLG